MYSHRSCIISILGVSRSEQHCPRLTTADLARRAGIPEDICTPLCEYRIHSHWLCHVARMDAVRIPQKICCLCSLRQRDHSMIQRSVDETRLSVICARWIFLSPSGASSHRIARNGLCGFVSIGCLFRHPGTSTACMCGGVFRRNL